jgi:hypothetical protein
MPWATTVIRIRSNDRSSCTILSLGKLHLFMCIRTFCGAQQGTMHLAGVVRQLNKERDRAQAKVEHLDKALGNLGSLNGSFRGVRPKKRKVSAAARRRMAAAQRARWAKVNAAQTASMSPIPIGSNARAPLLDWLVFELHRKRVGQGGRSSKKQLDNFTSQGRSKSRLIGLKRALRTAEQISPYRHILGRVNFKHKM